MEKKSYLHNVKTVFDSNYTIKSRRHKENQAKHEKEKKRNVLKVH
jgi:hypothetical protein